MTEEKNIGTNLNLKNNELRNVRIPIVADNAHDNSAIPKKYVDDKLKLNTPTSTANTNATTKVGGITIGTPIHDVPLNNIISDMLFERIPPTYTLPVLSFGITNLDTIDKEVGSTVSITVNSSVVNNDSSGANGVNPYTLHGNILSSSNIDSNMNKSIDVTLAEQSNLILDYTYNGANVKNDNLGTPNSNGIFTNGTIQKQIDFTAYWAYYSNVYSGDVALPTDSVGIKAIGNKIIGVVPQKLQLATLTRNIEQTILIAIPYDDNIQMAFYMDGYNITSACESSIVNYQNGSLFKQYIVCKINTGVGVNSEKKIIMKII